ncbi:MAG: HAMP domain-containing sensor histidine kinase [Actinomycetota bacterium]|nr:HAMP domain-containing sensor histidine kinase [Actinomycetota bacterium]
MKVRAAFAAALIVGAAFAASGAVATSLLRSTLYTSATGAARAEAFDIASFIETRGRVPRRLPVAAQEMAAQVVGVGGRVVTSSANVAGLAPMLSRLPAPGASSTGLDANVHLRPGRFGETVLDYRFAVVAQGLAGGPVRGAVLVAYSLGASDKAVALVDRTLLVVLPVLAVLVGALVWLLTGRALRPVELIRAEVAELSGGDLSRRVPVPVARDEIGRLASTMNLMLARLETATSRQRQLVADVSHELRNPLAALRAQLEVAVSDPGEDTAELLHGSVADVDRMTGLVNDLLTLARIDEGTAPASVSEVDLDELVLESAESLGRRGRVEVSVAGVGAARLRGDAAQLRRVVRNLADNAERHARSRVAFAVRDEGESVVLAVSDDGPGVPEDMRERVFERFVRIDESRSRRESGAGLGLAIVREIVRAHGGEVWVEDGAPGARFVVRLPESRRPSGP